MTSLLSVDVDDAWYALRDSFGVAVPPNYESSILRALELTLDHIESSGSRATFFVQGWVARRWPEKVRLIHQRGHRVASHGMTHKLAFDMSLDEFRRSLIDSRSLLEDVVGQRILGYRSPSFSIVPIFKRAIDAIREAGYVYDASAHFRRSQLDHRSVAPLRFELENGLLEFPLSSRFVGGRGLSIGSSIYCRRIPAKLHDRLLRGVERESGGVHVYFHPWELAGEEMPINHRLRHPKMLLYRGGAARGARRIAALLNERRYQPIESIVERHQGETQSVIEGNQ